MDLKIYKKEACLIKKNKEYNLYDKVMKNLVLSLTELNPNQETNGHLHQETEEIYFFVQGNGYIKINKKKEKVKAKDVILIKKGDFHKVLNNSKKNKLIFYSVFKRYQGRGK